MGTLAPERFVVTDASGVPYSAPDVRYKTAAGAGQIYHGDIIPTLTGDFIEVQTVEDINNTKYMLLFADDITLANRIYGRRAGTRDIMGDPTETLEDMIMMELRASGYEAVGVTTGVAITVKEVADGDWDGTSHPTRFEFWATPVGSTTMELIATLRPYSFNLHNASSEFQINGVPLSTGGGDTVFGQYEIDFGSGLYQTYEEFTVTQAEVLPTSNIDARILLITPSDGRDLDEILVELFDLKCLPGTGDFVLKVNSLCGSVTGKFIVGYTVHV